MQQHAGHGDGLVHDRLESLAAGLDGYPLIDLGSHATATHGLIAHQQEFSGQSVIHLYWKQEALDHHLAPIQ
jgi:hypothetical protein